jgi:hypothetical protein
MTRRSSDRTTGTRLTMAVVVRKLQIDTMAPVHGDVIPFSQFMEEAIFLTAKPPTVH